LTARDAAVAVLLALAGLSALLSLAGVAVMRGPYNRLHYLAPVSVIGGAAVAIAVVVKELFNTRGIKAILVFVVLAGLNPLLVHAVARAGHEREVSAETIRRRPRARGARG
jgi:multicomponent Na+:H+ antiporter subunit G